jgi:hypothetical protein
MGDDMVSGSLAEIEMIQDWFEGNVTVYRLDDEWRDEEKVFLEGLHEEAENALNNRRVLIETDQRDRVTPRWLTSWVRRQQGRMLGDLHFPQIREQLRRRCFCQMEWEGRPIENIYFNLEKRKVYLQLGGHKR